MGTHLAEPLTQRSRFLEALDVARKDPAHWVGLIDDIEGLEEAAKKAETAFELKKIETRLKILSTSANLILKVAEAPPLFNFDMGNISLEEANRMVASAEQEANTLDLGEYSEFHCNPEKLKEDYGPIGEIQNRLLPKTKPRDTDWSNADPEKIKKAKARLNEQSGDPQETG